VIQEFLAPKVVPQQVSLKIMSPDLLGLQEFCLKNLEWPEEYTREKVLLLITYWQMTSSLQHHTTTLVQPERYLTQKITFIRDACLSCELGLTTIFANFVGKVVYLAFAPLPPFNVGFQWTFILQYYLSNI